MQSPNLPIYQLLNYSITMVTPFTPLQNTISTKNTKKPFFQSLSKYQNIKISFSHFLTFSSLPCPQPTALIILYAIICLLILCNLYLLTISQINLKMSAVCYRGNMTTNHYYSSLQGGSYLKKTENYFNIEGVGILCI